MTYPLYHNIARATITDPELAAEEAHPEYMAEAGFVEQAKDFLIMIANPGLVATVLGTGFSLVPFIKDLLFLDSSPLRVQY